MGLRLLFMILPVISALTLFGQKNHYFAPQEGAFSVNFPGIYSIRDQEGDDARTVKAECHVDEEYFLASFTTLPEILLDAEETTRLSFEFFKEAVNARELSRKPWSMSGKEGLSAYLVRTEDSVAIEYRILIIGETLYQLAYLAPEPVYSEENASSFMESFELFRQP